jgi:hypothetical protein
MTGIRFYERFKDEQKRESAGKAVAVYTREWREGSEQQGRLFKAVVALGAPPNPPAVLTTISERYLQKKCRLISEARARQMTPNLFRILEARYRDAMRLLQLCHCGSTAETAKHDQFLLVNRGSVSCGSIPGTLNASAATGSHCEKTPEGVRL